MYSKDSVEIFGNTLSNPNALGVREKTDKETSSISNLLSQI